MGRGNHFIECGTDRGFRTSLGRGCGPCTRSEKTRKSAQRIFSRLCDEPLARLASVKAALRCRVAGLSPAPSEK